MRLGASPPCHPRRRPRAGPAAPLAWPTSVYLASPAPVPYPGAPAWPSWCRLRACAAPVSKTAPTDIGRARETARMFLQCRRPRHPWPRRGSVASMARLRPRAAPAPGTWPRGWHPVLPGPAPRHPRRRCRPWQPGPWRGSARAAPRGWPASVYTRKPARIASMAARPRHPTRAPDCHTSNRPGRRIAVTV